MKYFDGILATIGDQSCKVNEKDIHDTVKRIIIVSEQDIFCLQQPMVHRT